MSHLRNQIERGVARRVAEESMHLWYVTISGPDTDLLEAFRTEAEADAYANDWLMTACTAEARETEVSISRKGRHQI